MMAELKELCIQVGLSNVITYIQSGNVIFESNSLPKSIAGQLKKAIADTFEYDVPVLVISLVELIQTRTFNPYLNEPEVKQLYYTFLDAIPEEILIKSIESIRVVPEAFSIVNSTVYINYINYFKGYRSTKLTNDIVEKKLKVAATSRNAKTVDKLIEPAS
ncbi:MAG: hypothetical protein ACI8QQ_002607, partial [Psychroserpens sp.]